MRAYVIALFCLALPACTHNHQTVAIGDQQVIDVGPTAAAGIGLGSGLGDAYSQDVRTTGRAINDLNAYRDFKINHPELFAINTNTNASIEAAEAINVNVNHAISYQDDEPGIAEVWHIEANGGEGNCHDYAVTKLAKMVAVGMPRTALRLTVASVKNTGEWHLMLAVDVPGRGTFFMDSNRENILTAAEARDLYTLWFMENPASQRMELVG